MLDTINDGNATDNTLTVANLAPALAMASAVPDNKVIITIAVVILMMVRAAAWSNCMLSTTALQQSYLEFKACCSDTAKL